MPSKPGGAEGLPQPQAIRNSRNSFVSGCVARASPNGFGKSGTAAISRSKTEGNCGDHFGIERSRTDSRVNAPSLGTRTGPAGLPHPRRRYGQLSEIWDRCDRPAGSGRSPFRPEICSLLRLTFSARADWHCSCAHRAGSNSSVNPTT